MEELETYAIRRGDNLYLVLTFEEPGEGEAPATAFDLSVYDNIICEFREGPAQHTPLVHRATLADADIVISGAGNNIMVIELPANTTNEFGPGTYHYDIRFVLGDQVESLLGGIVNVTSNISEI